MKKLCKNCCILMLLLFIRSIAIAETTDNSFSVQPDSISSSCDTYFQLYTALFCADNVLEHGEISENIQMIQRICDVTHVSVTKACSLISEDNSFQWSFSLSFGTCATLQLQTESFPAEDEIMQHCHMSDCSPAEVLATWGCLRTEEILLIVHSPVPTNPFFYDIPIDMFMDTYAEIPDDAEIITIPLFPSTN